MIVLEERIVKRDHRKIKKEVNNQLMIVIIVVPTETTIGKLIYLWMINHYRKDASRTAFFEHTQLMF
jgi:hypothetical protein